MLTDYLAAKAGAAPYLAGYPIMDALSHYDLYEKGAVQIPVIHSGTVHTFLEKGYTHPWVYYCCGQDANISNRHFAMPLSRTREMGMELYKYQCRGFLQWGYNFYHSSQSLRVIDPYAVTDADRDFPAGDAFSVYPGKEDCLESIRLVAFTAGLADLAALRLLEKKLPHAEVVDLLEQDGPITFLDAPHGMDWLLAARERVNAALCRAYGVK